MEQKKSIIWVVCGSGQFCSGGDTFSNHRMFQAFQNQPDAEAYLQKIEAYYKLNRYRLPLADQLDEFCVEEVELT